MFGVIILNLKLPCIASLLEKHYIETSHLFCKGFFEPLLNPGVKFDAVILRRNEREVALSLFQLNTIPGRTNLGLKYLLYPEVPDVLSLKNWEKLHDYQLCYWYCLEINRRMGKYRSMVQQKGLKVISIKIEDLMSLDVFKKFISRLSLPELILKGCIKYFLLRNKKNTKKNLKIKNINTIEKDLEKMESEVHSLIRDVIHKN